VARVLLIDESLSKHLATELTARGLPAKDAGALNIKGQNDQVVLGRLAALTYSWVLVTGDDEMPHEHETLIRQIQATIATVDGQWERICLEKGLARTQEEFKRDTVHRWAHAMAEQETGSIRRYSPVSHREWIPRTRSPGARRQR
jgi:hypothetical protein